MSERGLFESKIAKLVQKGPICAALIDPEDFSPKRAGEVAKAAEEAGASIILVGGSTVADQGRLDAVIRSIKHHVASPVGLFPNNITGISHHADFILFSSLLNSTNPYFLIGAQAIGAAQVYKTRLEPIPMGYLVFEGPSTTRFVGQVNGLPPSKPGIAAIYALAAQYLGMRTLYLEAGSGANEPVPIEAIRAVRKVYNGILLVGGGITTPERARAVARAGADIIVVGNLLQTDDFQLILKDIAKAIAQK